MRTVLWADAQQVYRARPDKKSTHTALRERSANINEIDRSDGACMRVYIRAHDESEVPRLSLSASVPLCFTLVIKWLSYSRARLRRS